MRRGTWQRAPIRGCFSGRVTLQLCAGLKDSGDYETVDEMYRLYLEEERGYLINPEVEKLKKKARRQLKQGGGLRTLRHMSAHQKTQDGLVGMQREQMMIQQRWAASMSVIGGGRRVRQAAPEDDGGRKRIFESAEEVGAAGAADEAPRQGCHDGRHDGGGPSCNPSYNVMPS